MTTVANLPPASLVPVANLKPVSLTSVANVLMIWRFAAGVVDRGGHWHPMLLTEVGTGQPIVFSESDIR
jgi:hypothetical protein